MADVENIDEVREMFARRKQEIIARYQAQGAGVGKSKDGKRYEIVVYLEKHDPATPPSEDVEGVAVRLEVKGTIRKL